MDVEPATSKGTFQIGTNVFEAAGNGVNRMVDLVAADGTTCHWSFTAKYDGKDNSVIATNPYGDTVAFTHPRANTYNVVVKKGTQPLVPQATTLAEDGQTRATTVTGTDLQGQPVEGVSFYATQ
jgi:hypothetical protein